MRPADRQNDPRGASRRPGGSADFGSAPKVRPEAGVRRSARRFVRALGGVALVLSLGWGGSRVAQASIVERVVAVVGERPILLSELRHRARPHLYQVLAQNPDPSQLVAAESQLYRELLNRMIDERLEQRAADKARLSVTPEEIDRAVRQVATNAKLTPAQLLEETRLQGFTDQDYRDELRRQLLEGKLIELRVRGRVRVTEQDARSAYARYVREMAQQSPVDLRILVLQVPPGAAPKEATALRAMADDLARRGQSGEDFCALVAQYSQDPSTKSTCGSRGPVPLSALFPELQQAAQSLPKGGVSDTISFQDPSGNRAFLVVQLAESQGVAPPYEQVHDQMMESAYVEATKRQHQLWLNELRRSTYIDVRL